MTVQQKGGRISQGLKGDPFRGDISATLSPTERRTPSHEVPQSKPHRGRCGADRGRGSTATLHIATYNTRTLALQDDLDHLQEKLEDFKWNVIGLCETKRKGEGLMELSDGTWIYDAGKTEESPETKGMAFLVRKNFKDYIEGFCKHSDRVISCKVKLQEGPLQIIQVYAPTTDYDDEEAEKFYEDLENAIEKKCANTVIMGDFNAKIGVKDEDEENEWIGPFGIGTRNGRGEKLIDFCTANRLFVTNSFFKKPRPRYWTWESPGGDYKNQIDFILTTDKTTIQNTEIITKVDIGSDHRMIRSRMTINKKLTRLKRIKKKKPLKINYSFSRL
ncbi:hypothetical protein RRG08_025243 [Elysia crispata]|uniref:Endonuclease/exonuclease/phosphatase domain-containing protein n=1 Tax=Elysia crispata TaxID=231223 RepID=A0AAE1DV29_9GAST|nr:hypothetical protein RRG08_025243 [Elysia crispata]